MITYNYSIIIKIKQNFNLNNWKIKIVNLII